VEDMLDEGIHLTAACQLIGFWQHVIGSLWQVYDRHCVQVAKEVYETLLQSHLSDDSVSLGQHRAVLNLRNGPVLPVFPILSVSLILPMFQVLPVSPPLGKEDM
jgi:hypothetical protein